MPRKNLVVFYLTPEPSLSDCLARIFTTRFYRRDVAVIRSSNIKILREFLVLNALIKCVSGILSGL